MRWLLLLSVVVVAGCDRSDLGVTVDPNGQFQSATTGVTRIEFVNRSLDADGEKWIESVHTIEEASQIAEFMGLMDFDPFRESVGITCACSGDPITRLYSSQKLLTEFTLHHCRSIRWPPIDVTDLQIKELHRADLKLFLSTRGIDCE